MSKAQQSSTHQVASGGPLAAAGSTAPCEHEWEYVGRNLIYTEHGTFGVSFRYCPLCDDVRDEEVEAR